MVTKSNMPADVLNEYQALNNEVIWLSAAWNIFTQTFRAGQVQLDLLDQAKGFFGIARTAIRNSVFVGICRLTDPPASRRGGRENLSLARLAALTRSASNQPDEVLDELVAKAERSASPFRSWRNRLLAHADLETMLNLRSDAVPAIPDKDVGAAIEALGACLNHIQVRFDSTSTVYDRILITGDGAQLLGVLRDSKAHQEHITQGWGAVGKADDV